jgi:hypothetical protein
MKVAASSTSFATIRAARPGRPPSVIRMPISALASGNGRGDGAGDADRGEHRGERSVVCGLEVPAARRSTERPRYRRIRITSVVQ